MIVERLHLSDDDLRQLIASPESDLVERKRSIEPKAFRRNVCAFANDLAGSGRPGIILIGVEDDRRSAGTTIDDELLKNLANMRDDGLIQPLPSLTVERRRIDEFEVAVVIVEPSHEPPVRFQGRAYVRVGPTTRLATAEDERRLIEQRRASDLPFDLRPSRDAWNDELDLRYFRDEYLPLAVAADVLEQNERPIDQQLGALRMTGDGRPTNGGLLVLGRDPLSWIPGARIQFLRIDGTEITDPILDQKNLNGRLDTVLRQLDEVLAINISTRTEFASSPVEMRQPDYPLPALQQLTRNAVMHRSYEGTNAPIRVYWFKDRLEIQSPGGLYGRVTPENFGCDATDYRNPLVAEAMHHLGYAQRFGIGIALAKRTLEDNGNPSPKFDFEPTSVLVTLRSSE